MSRSCSAADRSVEVRRELEGRFNRARDCGGEENGEGDGLGVNVEERGRPFGEAMGTKIVGVSWVAALRIDHNSEMALQMGDTCKL